MAYRWPAETAFKRIDVDVEDRSCPVCERYMHVCDHRYHHLWTFEGPTQVVNRLVRCPDPSCASRGRPLSPEAAIVHQHAPVEHRLGRVLLARPSPLCPPLVDASAAYGVTGHPPN